MKDFLSLLKTKKAKLKKLKIKRRDLYGFLFLFLVSFLFFFDVALKSTIAKFSVIRDPGIGTQRVAYPKLTTVLGTNSTQDLENTLQLTAGSAIVLDKDSQTVLYSKNANLRFSTASTAKIMTALTSLSAFKLDDIITVKSLTEGSLVGFKVGEQVRFEDMLYGMLLPSGNDAALAIAENYPGGEKAFVAKMNENAQAFHLVNTHFADPAGLDDDGDYTTALDLARLASIASQNEEFAKIVSTKLNVITDITGKNSYLLHNLNVLLGIDGVNGIKTGFTDEAGGVLVTSKVEKGHTLIIVVMKSDDRFADTEALLSLVSGNVQFINP